MKTCLLLNSGTPMAKSLKPRASFPAKISKFLQWNVQFSNLPNRWYALFGSRNVSTPKYSGRLDAIYKYFREWDVKLLLKCAIVQLLLQPQDMYKTWNSWNLCILARVSYIVHFQRYYIRKNDIAKSLDVNVVSKRVHKSISWKFTNYANFIDTFNNLYNDFNIHVV